MLLIKNTKIVDGSGEPLRQADVLISGDKISAIGHFPHKKADVVIEGLGMYLTPGFIEPHTHADHLLTLFTDPEQKECRAQGITTIIGGNDGISLAPLLRGSLRGFGRWVDTNAININWHSMAECARAINRMPLGVNFSTLVGYGTIRRAIACDMRADLTDKELKVILNIIEKTLREGVLGISVNMARLYDAGMSHYELMAVAQTAARHDRTFALHPGAEEGNYMHAASRALALYQTTGAAIVLKNFMPRAANAACAKEFMFAYDAIKNAGNNLFIEISFTETVLTPLYELLPRWAQEENFEDMCALLQNRFHRKQIAKELPRIANARIIRAPREYRRLIGKTLEEYSLSRDCSFKEGVLALMECTKLRVVLAVPHLLENVLTAHLMEHPQSLFSGTPRVIFKAADQKRWPIEKTVARLTAVPARVYNLKQRGVIRENYYADLVVMNDRYEIMHTIVGGSLEPNAGRFIHL